MIETLNNFVLMEKRLRRLHYHYVRTYSKLAICLSQFNYKFSNYGGTFSASRQYVSLSTWSLFFLGTVLILASLKGAKGAVTFDYAPRPEFVETSTELNVTSYIDQTTRLPCTVRHLGTKRVSWIRERDLQVLSSGRTTFASDIRISILPGTRISKRYKKRSVPSDAMSERNFKNENFFDNKFVSAQNLFSGESLHRHERSIYRSRSQYYDGKNFSSYPNSMWVQLERRRIDPRSSSYKPVSDTGYRYDYKYNTTVPQRYSSGLTYNDVVFNYPLTNNYKTQTDGEETYINSHIDDITVQNVATTQESPILILPSRVNGVSKITNTQRRTVLPYNYLDEIWEPEDFTLQIKFTKPADSGRYICQVNTEPRMSQVIRLSVIDMVAKIAGQKELFVKEGSPVVLACKVFHGKNLPGFIFWFKNGELVDYDSSGGRIKIETTPNGRSKLLLSKAVREDSANYSCSPSGGKSDSTILTVIIDERPAAMQKGIAVSSQPNHVLLMGCLLTLSTLRLRVVALESFLLFTSYHSVHVNPSVTFLSLLL